MNKHEFLDELKRNLVGEVPRQEVEKNIAYYNEYISSNSNDMTTEQKTIEEIGEPRLIARTIVETYKISHKGYQAKTSTANYYEEFQTSSGSTERYEGQDREDNPFKLPLRIKIMGIITFIVVFMVLFIIAKFFLTLLFPIIAVAIIVGLIIKLFQK